MWIFFYIFIFILIWFLIVYTIHGYHQKIKKQDNHVINVFNHTSSTTNENENENENTNDKNIPQETCYERANRMINQNTPGCGNDIIQLLMRSIEIDQDPRAVIVIASLYENGLHNEISPNKIVACRIYQTIQEFHSKFPRHIVQTAKQKFTQLLVYQNTVDTDHDPNATQLSTDFPFQLARILVNYPSNENTQTQTQTQTQQHTQTQQQRMFYHHMIPTLEQHVFENVVVPTTMMMINDADDDNDHIDDNDNEHIDIQRVLHNDIQEIAHVQMRVNNDAQNVHSSSVLGSSQLILEKIEKNTKLLSFEQCQQYMIDTCIEKNRNIDYIRNVISTFNDTPHSRFQCSDKHVFIVVVSHVQKQSENTKNQLMEILCQQIESAVERGHVVCNTGRIVRMLSIYDGMDIKDLSIVPEWVVEQEIANTAARIQKELYDSASESERNEYNNPSNTESSLRKSMIKKFEKDVEKEYADLFKGNTKLLYDKIEVYKEGF